MLPFSLATAASHTAIADAEDGAPASDVATPGDGATEDEGGGNA